jgi:hypothetical protein
MPYYAAFITRMILHAFQRAPSPFTGYFISRIQSSGPVHNGATGPTQWSATVEPFSLAFAAVAFLMRLLIDGFLKPLNSRKLACSTISHPNSNFVAHPTRTHRALIVFPNVSKIHFFFQMLTHTDR